MARLRAAMAVMALAVPLAPVSMATAASSDLFFSEYVEGAGFNKALEIYNGTGASVTLTGEYSVQIFFNGSGSAGTTLNLVGTVAPVDVFVVAEDGASQAILNDAVLLRRGATTVDSIGQVGLDPGTEWGSGLTSTADNTLRRRPGVEAGDTSTSDAFDPAVQWVGYSSDTTAGLGTHLSQVADVDGDSRTDLYLFRPTTGVWYVDRSGPANPGAAQFGQSGDIPVPADYDGDGHTDLAVFRPSNGAWYLRPTSSPFRATQFGLTGDVPVPGDYDGDGRADLAVFRPSTGVWYAIRSDGGTLASQFGVTGDVPVPGDYDGDGDTDIAVFRPSTNTWYAGTALIFGANGDVPVPADYDGDGDTDIAVFRPSTGVWYVRSPASSIGFGTTGDIPVPGDYDGDDRADRAVFRPSNGVWYVARSSGGGTATAFGQSGDHPLPLPAAIRGAYFFG